MIPPYEPRRNVLACKRLTDLTAERAALTGSVTTACDWCGARVWVVPKNLNLRHTHALAVACDPCVGEYHARALAAGEVVVVLPAAALVPAPAHN